MRARRLSLEGKEIIFSYAPVEAQSGSSVGTYSLFNLEQEYETIDNDGIASEV